MSEEMEENWEFHALAVVQAQVCEAQIAWDMIRNAACVSGRERPDTLHGGSSCERAISIWVWLHPFAGVHVECQDESPVDLGVQRLEGLAAHSDLRVDLVLGCVHSSGFPLDLCPHIIPEVPQEAVLNFPSVRVPSPANTWFTFR